MGTLPLPITTVLEEGWIVFMFIECGDGDGDAEEEEDDITLSSMTCCDGNCRN